VSGALAGAAAVLAADHYAGSMWWVLPALLCWAVALAAVGCCDSATQRVPTALVRQAGVVTLVLLAAGSMAIGDYRALAMAAVASAAAGAILAVCWRFAGAGFGDVRLAVLGGLGLGHATERGLVVAVAAFILITVGLSVLTLARGGNRHTAYPYGPALATAFLLAAAM
jgi:leader peptidase (prepilin peptidase) / N-methyltransferase